jgi:ketosteroid isomerase-like protein
MSWPDSRTPLAPYPKDCTMTTLIEKQRRLSLLARFYLATNDLAWQNPAQAYAEFLAAVGRRDANSVLARMSEDYSRKLRGYRSRHNFAQFFALWCENYPRHQDVVACFIDGDTAILETTNAGASGLLAGRVVMVLNEGRWRVGSEHCDDERIRIPTGRLSPCQFT